MDVSRKQLARGGGDLDRLGTDDTGCVILHIDMDAFFVGVELLSRPELRGRPVVVGGSGGRGVVVSASYEARAYGVHAAMPVGRAMTLCPQAILIPPSRGLYSACSKQVFDIVARVTDEYVRVSIDEGYVDVTSAVRRLGSPGHIAHRLRAAIQAETGLVASIGAASTKVVAKLASTRAKPDGLLVVPVDRVADFLRPMPVEALPGVGQSTQSGFARYGLRTIADLADADEAWVARTFGAHGRTLRAFAHGIDDRPLHSEPKDHSVSAERTFADDVWDSDVLETELLRLCDDVAGRLRKEGATARGAGLKYRLADFTTFSRSVTLPVPSDLPHDLRTALLVPLRRLRAEHRVGVRLLGVRAHGLADLAASGRQASLFEVDDSGESIQGDGSTGDSAEGASDAQRALDEVRRRFGGDSITSASLLRRG